MKPLKQIIGPLSRRAPSSSVAASGEAWLRNGRCLLRRRLARNAAANYNTFADDHARFFSDRFSEDNSAQAFLYRKPKLALLHNRNASLDRGADLSFPYRDWCKSADGTDEKRVISRKTSKSAATVKQQQQPQQSKVKLSPSRQHSADETRSYASMIAEYSKDVQDKKRVSKKHSKGLLAKLPFDVASLSKSKPRSRSSKAATPSPRQGPLGKNERKPSPTVKKDSPKRDYFTRKSGGLRELDATDNDLNVVALEDKIEFQIPVRVDPESKMSSVLNVQISMKSLNQCFGSGFLMSNDATTELGTSSKDASLPADHTRSQKYINDVSSPPTLKKKRKKNHLPWWANDDSAVQKTTEGAKLLDEVYPRDLTNAVTASEEVTPEFGSENVISQANLQKSKKKKRLTAVAKAKKHLEEELELKKVEFHGKGADVVELKSATTDIGTREPKQDSSKVDVTSKVLDKADQKGKFEIEKKKPGSAARKELKVRLKAVKKVFKTEDKLKKRDSKTDLSLVKRGVTIDAKRGKIIESNKLKNSIGKLMPVSSLMSPLTQSEIQSLQMLRSQVKQQVTKAKLDSRDSTKKKKEEKKSPLGKLEPVSSQFDPLTLPDVSHLEKLKSQNSKIDKSKNKQAETKSQVAEKSEPLSRPDESKKNETVGKLEPASPLFSSVTKSDVNAPEKIKIQNSAIGDSQAQQRTRNSSVGKLEPVSSQFSPLTPSEASYLKMLRSLSKKVDVRQTKNDFKTKANQDSAISPTRTKVERKAEAVDKVKTKDSRESSIGKLKPVSSLMDPFTKSDADAIAQLRNESKIDFKPSITNVKEDTREADAAQVQRPAPATSSLPKPPRNAVQPRKNELRNPAKAPKYKKTFPVPRVTRKTQIYSPHNSVTHLDAHLKKYDQKVEQRRRAEEKYVPKLRPKGDESGGKKIIRNPYKPIEKRKDGTLVDYGFTVPTRKPKRQPDPPKKASPVAAQAPPQPPEARSTKPPSEGRKDGQEQVFVVDFGNKGDSGGPPGGKRVGSGSKRAPRSDSQVYVIDFRKRRPSEKPGGKTPKRGFSTDCSGADP